jgi:two-component system, OmpR family, sensor kinase
MRLAVLLSRSAVTMLALTSAAVGLAWWSNERSFAMTERIHLAHHSFEAHLNLRANVADLFKQYSDALLIGDRDKSAVEVRLKGAIWQNIGTVRQVVAQEIRLVGPEESSELDDLASLEATLRQQIIEIERLIVLPPNRRDMTALARILDDGIDRDLAAQIDGAIAHEAQEVLKAEQDSSRQEILLRQLLLGLMGLVLIGTTVLLLVWRRRMTTPLTALLKGVRELSRGNFDHRMQLAGHSEIAEVASVLDELSARVAARERTLTEQNAVLERAVADRTADLARMLDDANAKDDARRQMLADVSHELRTPLTIIMGESDIALRGEDKTADIYKEALGRTREAASHTSLLVDDLLFVARHEADRPRLVLDTFDLRQLMGQSVAMIDPALHVFSDLQPAPIRADRNRIRQAVLALVQNAKVHGGPNIRIRLLTTARGYKVQVEDDGPGLDPEDRERAFTRYFRGSNAAERYAEGSGLGLPIVRAIAEAHGGGAWLDERSGGGTVAVLELLKAPPRREEAA